MNRSLFLQNGKRLRFFEVQTANHSLKIVYIKETVTAAADTYNGWEYYTTSASGVPSGYEVVIYGCTKTGSVTVPGMIDGYYVTTVTGGTFYNNESVTSISFNSNPYLVLVGSFHGASNLRTVNMGSISLETLDDNQFLNCSSLTSLTIPSTVTTIRDSVSAAHGPFAYCPSLAGKDLDIRLWYHEAMDFVLSEGLMNGVGNGRFDPNGSTTRAQVAMILYRFCG